MVFSYVYLQMQVQAAIHPVRPPPRFPATPHRSTPEQLTVASQLLPGAKPFVPERRRHHELSRDLDHDDDVFVPSFKATTGLSGAARDFKPKSVSPPVPSLPEEVLSSSSQRPKERQPFTPSNKKK